ncbi:MAG: dihydrolipoyl dehydrogenase [Candidatus Omnitrophica bacterium]|nr:dihydrolipoyl dehydrogenase [Candidatus Omnitrophota bacterium]
MTGAYDLAVVGSGPGGCAAALTAVRRGLRVCLIEREEVGGVCLNVGCIPTKALLSVAALLRRLRQAQRMGVRVHGYEVDYAAVRARTERIITTLRRGLIDLLRREHVDVVGGSAAFESPRRLVVTREGRSHALDAERIVVATGARPLSGPWTVDEDRCLSYRGFLALPRLPASLLVIGGGVIGCEFASLLSACGSRVTLVEQEPRLLPTEDPEAVRWLTRRFEAEGVAVLTGTTVSRLEASPSDVSATLSNGTRLSAERCLIAIGQRPNIEALRLDAASVRSEGGVEVDEWCRTSQPHIVAIGDCVEGHGLAHWASAEGARAVRALLGDAPEPVDPLEVPRCVFTDPELAHIGILESQARGEVRVSRFSFGALGKSHCDEDTEGFVKLLVEPVTDRIRGATIVGAQASSLIHSAVLAIRHGLTAKQLARTITAHPTLPEGITEAAASLYGESLAVAARPVSRAGSGPRNPS